MINVGLNPYGIAYCLGLQGRGTPRCNPSPLSVQQYVQLAEDIGGTGIELDQGYISRLDDAGFPAMKDAIERNRWWVVLARFFQPAESFDQSIALAQRLGARLIRVSLTTVLCGDRANPACKWTETMAKARKDLAEVAKRLADHGMSIGIENHQDLTSAELMDLATCCGDNVGVVMDLANPLAVGEDCVEFAKTVAPRIIHLHLKNYWPQWTDEGFRLIRSPIGDGAVPFERIFEVFKDKDLTAGLELGALDNRHIRLLTDAWWQHYPDRSAMQLSKGLAAARVARMSEGEDHRTPWERNAPPQEIAKYELDQVWRSVENIAGWGLLKPRKDPREMRSSQF